MQYVYPLNGVYHTHYDEDMDMYDLARKLGTWPTLEQVQDVCHEADARDSATSTLYTDVIGTENGNVLMCASSGRGQILFELSAYEGQVIPHKLPRHLMSDRELKHARLWDDGRWDVREARYHAAHRRARGCGWKAHRKYQAHNRAL